MGEQEEGGREVVGRLVGHSSQNAQAAELFVQYLTDTATVVLDHSTSRDGHWKQFGALCCLINAPQWPHRLFCDSTWQQKPSVATILLCLDST